MGTKKVSPLPKTAKQEIIPVNIRDDDDDVPKGKRQETHSYIESEDYDMKEQLKILKYLCRHLNILKDFHKSKFSVPSLTDRSGEAYCQIKVLDLSHQHRKQLLETLLHSKLEFEDKVFDFYSES